MKPARRVARRVLAPLEPDAFLRWANGERPHTVESIWFELSHDAPDLTLEDVRRSYVRLAARVRCNQRFGIDPWEGLR